MPRPTVPLDAILFDFDGTLVESLNIKVAAFRSLYAGFGPDVAERAVAHYRAHTGVPRVQRFADCHRELLGREPSEAELAALSADFRTLVEEEVIRCPEVAGARAFLDAYAARIPCYVVSATPQEELERIVERRGMTRYFADLLGSPPDKTALVHDLISTEWYDPRRVVMVGDGRADLAAAEAAGCRFIGRVHPGEANPFPPRTPHVTDLTDLAAVLGLA